MASSLTPSTSEMLTQKLPTAKSAMLMTVKMQWMSTSPSCAPCWSATAVATFTTCSRCPCALRCHGCTVKCPKPSTVWTTPWQKRMRMCQPALTPWRAAPRKQKAKRFVQVDSHTQHATPPTCNRLVRLCCAVWMFCNACVFVCVCVRVCCERVCASGRRCGLL